MCVRYLQDIAFISESLAPEHNKIPEQWKIRIDKFWEIERERFESILSKIITNDINETQKFWLFSAIICLADA